MLHVCKTAPGHIVAFPASSSETPLPRSAASSSREPQTRYATLGKNPKGSMGSSAKRAMPSTEEKEERVQLRVRKT